jgi:hypothetical protein
MAKVGVMGLDGWPGLAAPLFVNNDAEAATLLEVRQMDKIDMKILEAINTISTKSLLVPSK